MAMFLIFLFGLLVVLLLAIEVSLFAADREVVLLVDVVFVVFLVDGLFDTLFTIDGVIIVVITSSIFYY